MTITRASPVVSAVTLILFLIASSRAYADRSIVIFQQPEAVDLNETFVIPKASRQPPPTNKFSLILWQTNPSRIDGSLIPSRWDAGEKTGLHVPDSNGHYQLSFQDKVGSSTVQAVGDAVGAYLNSSDLPASTHKNKMMITPQFMFPRKQGQSLFLAPGDGVEVSLELQVPTANDHGTSGSNTYVSSDLQFSDSTSDTRISFGCNLFKLGRIKFRENVGYDEDSGNIMMNGPLYAGSSVYTPLPGSALHSTVTWRGWRQYRYEISYENFLAALKMIKLQNPNTKFSTNPADYRFDKFHLNAELHFGDGAAELGWSMKNAVVQAVTRQ